jgi:hypothetical protein
LVFVGRAVCPFEDPFEWVWERPFFCPAAVLVSISYFPVVVMHPYSKNNDHTADVFPQHVEGKSLLGFAYKDALTKTRKRILDIDVKGEKQIFHERFGFGKISGKLRQSNIFSMQS